MTEEVLETPGNDQPWLAYKEPTSILGAIRGLVGGQAVVRGGITVKPHVQRFATDLEDFLGSKQNYGTYNGHSPPEGPTQAIDHFNPNNAAGHRQQDVSADWAIAHAEEYGLRYVIKRGKIWNIERADEGWRQMRLTGNPTADHLDHNHYTFYARARYVPDEPTIPIKKIGDVMSLSVRFIHDPVDDATGRVDWVFDGPSRIFMPVGDSGVLKATDACKFPELGEVNTATYEWFRNAARAWGGR